MLRPSPNHWTQRLPNDDDDLDLAIPCLVNHLHTRNYIRHLKFEYLSSSATVPKNKSTYSKCIYHDSEKDTYSQPNMLRIIFI